MSKYTPWFPGDVKPRRRGVYQQFDGLGRSIGYQFWDGKLWGCWCETPEMALHEAKFKSVTQDDPWRGLAKKPE